MACDALCGPHRSKAMGPTRAMKQPSKRPSISAMTISQANVSASVSSMALTPMARNEVCNGNSTSVVIDTIKRVRDGFDHVHYAI